jgi:OOP family OmpA-OmpF porin
MIARNVVASALATAAVVSASAASAQTREPNIDVQTFWPAAGPQQGVALRSAEVQPHLNFGFTVLSNYSYRPLVYRPMAAPMDAIAAIDHAYTVDFLWAFGLFDRVQIMAALPMVVAQTGAGIRPITGGGIGDELSLIALRDPRIDVAVQIVKRARRTNASGFALRGDVGVTFPSGDDRFQSNATVVLQPVVVADVRFAGLTITANVGARLGFESRSWAGAYFPPQLLGSLGVSYRPSPLPRLSVAVDSQFLVPIEGRPQVNACLVPPCGDSSTATTAGELFVGARYAVDRGRDVEVTAGVGAPLTAAAGVPIVRGLLGIAFTPRALDDDSDGVRESDDRCPSQPEDRDSFEDNDGCPDPDNDQDRIPDERDRCPNQPEDADNFRDEDGCPEPDNDGDGVLDADDRCADEAAGPRPDPDNRGCPIRDRDGDEVLDVDDQCPEEPVGQRADPARRGCPLPDRDRDGVGDSVDQCASDPAGDNPDRFRRGCPDPDVDHDGVPNETDSCPQAETINGVDDADGCPDAGEEAVTVGRGAVLFGNVVRLAPRARALRPAETALFTQASQRLRGLGAELARVTVGVVADARDREGREAQRLAQLVADVLIANGVTRALVEVRPILPQPPTAPQPGAGRRPAPPPRAPVGEVRITLLRNAATR